MNRLEKITIPDLISILEKLEEDPNKKDILIDNQYITYSYTSIKDCRTTNKRSYSFIDLLFNINYTDI